MPAVRKQFPLVAEIGDHVFVNVQEDILGSKTTKSINNGKPFVADRLYYIDPKTLEIVYEFEETDLSPDTFTIGTDGRSQYSGTFTLETDGRSQYPDTFTLETGEEEGHTKYTIRMENGEVLWMREHKFFALEFSPIRTKKNSLFSLL